MSFLKDLFTMGKEVPLYLEKGAAVIDVRSELEFKQGHPKGAINIPLDRLSSKKDKIMGMKKPIIFCCVSGSRSGQAASIMKKQGLDCINGGGWTSVNSKMQNS